MSTDNETGKHGDDHSNGQDHGGDHAPAAAADIIPENSPQDLILKGVTIVAAVLISGSFIWWNFQPYPSEGEGHGGVENVQH